MNVAIKTTMPLLCNSDHVGQETLLVNSSTASSMYVLIPVILNLCTGGRARTYNPWFWRPVLYQLSHTRLFKRQKVRRQNSPRTSAACLSIYSRISVTCPAPTVRPPSRIANLRPLLSATGAIRITSIVRLSPGITISRPSPSMISPVTSVVLT